MKAMRSIESHERLLDLSQMDWPNKKESVRQREWRDLHKSAYPNNYSNNMRKVSTKELFEIVSGR